MPGLQRQIAAMPMRLYRSRAVMRCLSLGIILLATAPGGARHPKSDSACCAVVLATNNLRARVMPPHEETIAAYVEAGASSAKAHQLSDREWALVERAFADLPPLYQRILSQRLGRLSFIDAPSSAGTALTRRYDGQNGEQFFDITIRADVLEMSLTGFLQGKEERLFADDRSGYTLRISAGKMPALTYLLLHEATHVLDQTFGISSDARPFASLWKDYRTLSEPYASGPIGVSAYRRGPQLPRGEMPALYRAFTRSPFVSLYSTASAGEDFAELAAWRILSRDFHVPLSLQVRDAKGNTVLTVTPLASPAVQSRLDYVQRLLADAATTQ